MSPMAYFKICVLIGVLMLEAVPGVLAYEASDSEPEEVESEQRCDQRQRYTFSWPLLSACDLEPRGGTTQGTPVKLDSEAHPGWLALQDSDLSNFERDRQAILAMAGPYRATFDFLEIAGYTPDFVPDPPYQSWGTEYIYVVEDDEDFISLQHLMVMFFQREDEIVGPMVMKHWRQDWHYQPKTLLVYAGHNRWHSQKLPRRERRGQWVQSVFQVDDSPRYAAAGRWQHKPNLSTWLSERTWRPLPRREHTVRDDYQVLEGHNRHTILPSGWLHEEENYKLQLDEQGKPLGDRPYLSKELGVNRYDRIVDFDFSAGDKYWAETGEFWAIVRNQWQALFDKHSQFGLREAVDDTPLFVHFFGFAEQLQAGNRDIADAPVFVQETLQAYTISSVD